MATFLQLCQDVAVESGAVQQSPATTLGQTGRLAKCVLWTRRAWELIQTERHDWTFRRKQWSGTITAGQPTYNAASFNLDDFSAWLGDVKRFRSTTIYDPTIGRSDESALTEIPWELWLHRYDRGVHDAQRPTEYTRAPDRSILFGATPDINYTVRGLYRRSPQILAADDDVPIIPDDYHAAIVYRAIILMAESDEGVQAVALARDKYASLMSAMVRGLTPEVDVRPDGPLA